jgi:hypothetical protein
MRACRMGQPTWRSGLFSPETEMWMVPLKAGGRGDDVGWLLFRYVRSGFHSSAVYTCACGEILRVGRDPRGAAH